MLQPAVTFLSNYRQLWEWQEKLEFLCFTLCQIVAPDVVQRRHWTCYQAAELCDCAEELMKACDDEGGRLQPLIQDKERRVLKDKLQEICHIRHAVAHRIPQSEHVMRRKKALAQKTISWLEKLVAVSAESYQISRIEWYPVTCAMANTFGEQNSQVMTIELDELPVLSNRQKSLERFTAAATGLSLSQDRRRALLKKERNRQENEQLRQDAEIRKLNNIHKQLELYETAQSNRLRRRKEHYHSLLSTRARQLEQIHQATHAEEYVLEQLTSVPSLGSDTVPLLFAIVILVLATFMSF